MVDLKICTFGFLALFLIHYTPIHLWPRVLSRYFDQVGHETTKTMYASGGKKTFQTYQNYEESQQKLGIKYSKNQSF